MTNKIVYLVTEDWYFCSHRIDLAKAAILHGYEVTVITRVNRHGDIIRDAGINLISVNFQRNAKNIIKDLVLLFKLIGLYKDLQPAIVHHVSLKPVLIGSMAAYFANIPVVINALTGLGYLFSSDSVKAKIIRGIICPILSFFFKRGNSWVIFQNQDDQESFIRLNILSENRSCIIKGSGVDIDKFRPVPEPDGSIVVMLASRMLWDKGVGEFVESARIIGEQKTGVRFVLVGDIDLHNPMSLTRSELLDLQQKQIVDWWGQQDDMPSIFGQAHIICLPSYREGLPKVLLEAASSGRPIIATDVPGCREIVKHGVNGYLVPVKDGKALAYAINKLIIDREKRIQMGMKGRELVESEFSTKTVNAQTLNLYTQTLRTE